MLGRIGTVLGHGLWLLDYHTTVKARYRKARPVVV